MSVFDEVRENIIASFSEWIKVYDNKNPWTLENFSYKTGVDESLTNTHCWKCVTVNQCWFKNEEGKKPKKFDYTKYSFSEIPLTKRGLYHPNCHDKEVSINVPKISNLKIEKDINKINYFFKKKLKWYYSWGYKKIDREEFINNIFSLVKTSYRTGNYETEKHTKYGFQINIFFTIEGIRAKKGNYYNTWSSYIVYPNGKLRLITLIGGVSK